MTGRRIERISVIIPTLNESGHIADILASVQRAKQVETIVVDGGSSDDTAEKANACGARVIAGRRGRAVQMNLGAAEAGGDALLFLHADTRLPEGYERHIRRSLTTEGVAAGAFRLAIDAPGGSIRLMEQVANWRSRYLQMPYGDQALFVSTRLFKLLGGFPEMPIMEDFLLVRRLKRHGRIDIRPLPVVTSARRWMALGPWRTWLVNQVVISAFYLGVSPKKLATFYRRRGVSK